MLSFYIFLAIRWNFLPEIQVTKELSLYEISLITWTVYLAVTVFTRENEQTRLIRYLSLKLGYSFIITFIIGLITVEITSGRPAGIESPWFDVIVSLIIYYSLFTF